MPRNKTPGWVIQMQHLPNHANEVQQLKHSATGKVVKTSVCIGSSTSCSCTHILVEQMDLLQTLQNRINLKVKKSLEKGLPGNICPKSIQDCEDMASVIYQQGSAGGVLCTVARKEIRANVCKY